MFGQVNFECVYVSMSVAFPPLINVGSGFHCLRSFLYSLSVGKKIHQNLRLYTVLANPKNLPMAAKATPASNTFLPKIKIGFTGNKDSNKNSCKKAFSEESLLKTRHLSERYRPQL
jgi:hypothetical protein